MPHLLQTRTRRLREADGVTEPLPFISSLSCLPEAPPPVILQPPSRPPSSLCSAVCTCPRPQNATHVSAWWVSIQRARLGCPVSLLLSGLEEPPGEAAAL